MDYTLNNFTSLYDNFIVDHGKNNNFKILKRIILLGKKIFILSRWKLTLGWGSVQNLRERKSSISTSFMMIHNIAVGKTFPICLFYVFFGGVFLICFSGFGRGKREVG
jgi:hypothetical protein